MFYDYRDIFEADFLQEHQEMAEQLAMQVLISVLKGDQNYHYENVAFLCDKDGGIISLAPIMNFLRILCFRTIFPVMYTG